MANSGPNLPLMPVVQKIVGIQDTANVYAGIQHIVITFVVLIGLFLLITPSQTLHNFAFISYTAPLWVPILLAPFAWQRFRDAKKAEFISKQKYVLLEIRIPREVTKTPLAMETFFSNIHISSGESYWYQRILQGAVRPWWSFELVSIGGRIHFYVWTRVTFRKLIESSLYAQYPDIEVIEAEDYSREVDPASGDYSMFSTEFKKAKPDPYPLKSYIEYGLTPGAKPEENVDPLAQMIELLGSISPNEQVWLQYIIRATKDEKQNKKTKDGKTYTWRDEAVDLIDDLRTKNSQKGQYIDPITGKLHETKIGNLTKGQTDVIAGIERNISKQGFDIGIRAVYLGKEGAFQGSMAGAIIASFKPFNNESNNTIVPQGNWTAQFKNTPWEDRSGSYRKLLHERVTRFYRQRVFFHTPYIGTWSVVSTEELATLFHVPGSGVTTPNLPRIQSTTSGAPANLPQ